MLERKRERTRIYAGKHAPPRAPGSPHPRPRSPLPRGKPTGRAGRPHKTNGGDRNVPAIALPAISAEAFWGHAAKLVPGRPWLAVTREFDVGEAIARGCYDRQRLPPGVGPMAVTQFLALAPG